MNTNQGIITNDFEASLRDKMNNTKVACFDFFLITTSSVQKWKAIADSLC